MDLIGNLLGTTAKASSDVMAKAKWAYHLPDDGRSLDRVSSNANPKEYHKLFSPTGQSFLEARTGTSSRDHTQLSRHHRQASEEALSESDHPLTDIHEAFATAHKLAVAHKRGAIGRATTATAIHHLLKHADYTARELMRHN